MGKAESPGWRGSRRAFLMGAGGLALGAFSGWKASEVYREYQKPPPYYKYDEYVKGFPQKSDEYRNRVIASFESDLHGLSLYQEDDGSLSGSFVADRDKLYGLQVNGVFDPEISLQPVLVTVGKKTRLVPVIQSAHYASSPLYIGELEGEQTVQVASINGDDSPVVDVQVREMTGDPFTREIIRNIPDLYIKKDSIHNLTSDVPLNMNFHLRENWFEVRMAEYIMRYVTESNQHVPYPLADEAGRVWDYDVVSLNKMTKKGEKLEEAIMAKAHDIYIVEQHPEPILLEWGERVRYQSVESNNMVSDDIETDISCSFLPDEFLDLTKDAWLDREMATNVLSIRAYIERGTLGEHDPFVLWQIQNEWDGHNYVTPIVAGGLSAAA